MECGVVKIFKTLKFRKCKEATVSSASIESRDGHALRWSKEKGRVDSLDGVD